MQLKIEKKHKEKRSEEMFGFSKKSGMSLDQIVVEHMKKKYNDEFEIASREYAGFYHGLDTFSMTCKSFPGERVRVEHNKKGVIMDNYLCHYYREAHRALMQGIMEDLIGECIVYSEKTNYTTTMGLETSFEEYRSKISAHLGTTVYVKNDKVIDFDKLANQCQKILQEQNIVETMLRIYVLRDNARYKLLEEKNYDCLKGPTEDKFIKQYYMAFNSQFELRSKYEKTYEL